MYTKTGALSHDDDDAPAVASKSRVPMQDGFIAAMELYWFFAPSAFTSTDVAGHWMWVERARVGQKTILVSLTTKQDPMVRK
jgi:hypothetical protein